MERGDIRVVVNASGEVKPVLSVHIGSFVSGPIEELFVDFNDEVKADQVLATIDPRIYIASVERDDAAMKTREAEVERVRAELQRAINDEERSLSLKEENEDFISRTELDQFRFNRMSLEAQLKIAIAAVRQAKANLENSEANLHYTKIRSPVDGIVIDKKIDPGQTLAAQFQTPELFVIAPDMRNKMHIFASVDEADIGLIREAQLNRRLVQFRVDAYRDEVFEQGEIEQIRLSAVTNQSVVTYPVIVATPNEELKLLPGMTAHLTFLIRDHTDVLKVPNAALRYFPDKSHVRPADQHRLELNLNVLEQGDRQSVVMQDPPVDAAAKAAAAARKRIVWVHVQDLLRAVDVTIGVSDYQFTEIVDGQLTEQGIVIGIGAVTTMVSIGSSAGQLVQNELQSIGTNFIFIQPSVQRRGGVRTGGQPTLTVSDALAIGTECQHVLAASPLVGTSGIPVIRGNNNMQPNDLHGVGADYLRVRNWQLQAGGFFSERDISAANPVCVVGHTVVRELFQTENPLGQTVRIRNIPFTIIGVLESKGASIGGQDQDSVLLMPYTTVKKRIHGSVFDDVHAVFVAARGPDLIRDAVNEINHLLMDRHHIAPGQKLDFLVQGSDEIASMLGKITGIMTGLLASIAGISLLVGGVGIMNIMLVSVTERTREIGIRMAVGARGRDILIQFLIESVVLSSFGGVIGMSLGIGASVGITKVINAVSSGSDWPVVVSIPAAITAMIFAALVGMIFGLYPAWRASRMDPIDALRYE